MEAMIRKWGGGEVLKRAVRGMLPKNKLRDPRLSRLKGKFFSNAHEEMTVQRRKTGRDERIG